MLNISVPFPFLFMFVLHVLCLTNFVHFFYQFHITKENRGNEGTCVGVARFPISDDSHRTTRDMWLYRAYSGNLYHNGEQSLTLPGYTQGDYITCVLDMGAGTLSLGKNGEVSRFLDYINIILI